MIEFRKNWMGTLILMALMVGTAWFFLHNQNMSQLISMLSTLRPEYIVMGLGLMVLYVSCEAMGSQQIFKRLGYQTSFKQCLGYSFVGFYVSSITPSATGGQPAQVYCMTKDNISVAHGTLDMMLISMCYQMVCLFYGVIAWVMMPQLRVVLQGGWGLLLIYGAITMICLTAMMGIIMFLPRVARYISYHILELLLKLGVLKNKQVLTAQLDNQLESYRQGATCIRKNPDLMVKLMMITVVQLTALFAVPYTVYLAFGLQGYGIIEIVLLQAVLTLAVSNLPLPGTVGAAEGIFVVAFSLFFGSDLVMPAMLISRGISFYIFLLISGFVTLLIHLHLRRRRRQEVLQALRGHTGGNVVAVKRYLVSRAREI